MMTDLLSYIGIILALVVLSLVFSWITKKETVHRAFAVVSWLVKVAYVDLVKMIIFIRPWKKYADQIGVGLWLILVWIAGRYILVARPAINQIPGPFIPMIGYIYFLSVIYIIKFSLKFSHKAE